ncbi:hypothetical protein ACFGVR_10535 [Mucilaginibacter sp. AW1-3]
MQKTKDPDLNIIFPTPGNLAGLTWLKTLSPPNRASRKVNVNVFAEQGTNPSWHAHPCEQMLIAMDATGYYQEKGKPMQSLGHGEVIFIHAGVEHWHAASLGCAFSHVVINANQRKQIITWLKRVKH